MFGGLRLTFAFVAAALAGSWFGLGKPSLAQSRDFAETERAKWVSRWQGDDAEAMEADPTDSSSSDTVASDGASDTFASSTAPDAPSGDAPHVRPALPQEIDPSGVSSMQPWPRLNPEVDVHRAWMLAEGPKRAPGDGRKLVTLTFDDGPFLETTPTVLKLLARYHVRATFFAVGQYLERDDTRSRLSRNLLRRIVDEGHLVGNHTLDHTLLTAISRTRVLDQIDRSAAAIERATGKYPYLFRPPYGQLDDFGRQAARERHLELVLWSAEAQDMTRDDTAQMYSELVAQLAAKDGGIVLLHDIRPTSIVVLKDLLKYLHERRFDPKNPAVPGYEIVDLPTYLRAVEVSPPSYASRDRVVDDDRRASRTKPVARAVEDTVPARKEPTAPRSSSRVASRHDEGPGDRATTKSAPAEAKAKATKPSSAKGSTSKGKGTAADRRLTRRRSTRTPSRP